MMMLPVVSTCAFVLLLVFLVPCTQSCGISTHVEIAHMAEAIFNDVEHSISYKQLITKHQDAFQAGNTYPDTYYTSICFKGQYHQVSEDTHWTPFTNVTIQYIRDNFPPPWSEETEKLVVFMLGFVSHQVADITWHSLGIRQGFIRTMAAVDFHGVYDTAHSTADFGGDVINAFRGDYSYVHFSQWYIPTQHLYKIYQLYYGSVEVPLDVIEECTTLVYLAVMGETIALGKDYIETAAKSPFLTQNLHSYFLGGMYDMALWSTSIWDNVIYILENGFSENCTTPENPLYIRCGSQGRYNTVHKTLSFHSTNSLQALYKRSINREDVMVEKTKYGISLRQKPAKSLPKRQPKKPTDSSRVSPLTIISSSKPYSQFGQAILLADVNKDGLDDLVISAPMYSTGQHTGYSGRVFVIYDGGSGFPKGEFDVEQLANVTLQGPVSTSGRFGSDVAVLDVNLDGYNDIVVSFPNYGWQNLTYTGALAVWYGNASGQFHTDPSLVHTDLHAPKYNNEGVHLFTEDVDNDRNADLIVSFPYTPGPAGPQNGKLCLIKSSKDFMFNTWKCIYGPGSGSNTSWFGSSVVVAIIPEVGRVLIASSPLYRLCSMPNCKFNLNDTQSAGQVTIWSLPDLKLIRAINGSGEHQHLGSSLAVGYPYGINGPGVLAVGLDSIDVNGSVFGVDVTLKQAGAVAMWNLSDLQPATDVPPAVLYGDRQFSMFGSVVQFRDLDSDGKDELLVGAPHYTSDPTEVLEGAEQGLVTIFGLQTPFPREDTSADVCGDSAIVPCTSKVAASLLGWSENKAHVGGRLAVSSFKKEARVAVTAIRSSHGAHQSGAVLIY